MVPDVNELEAVKAAALRDLFSGVGTHSITEADTTHNTKQLPKKTRRRKRPKSRSRKAAVEIAGQDGDDDDDNAQDTVEYVPEQIAALDNIHTAKSSSVDLDGNTDSIEQVIGSMRRFMERGVLEEPEAPEERNDDDENATKPRAKALETDARTDETGKERPENDKNDGGKEQTEEKPLSRKKQKELRRYQIAILKSLTDKPQVVDSWDVTAPDPFLLVHLKTWPNSVQVPSNWRQKRKYLQNKRGMEKKAFQLPAYIADTGVGEMRSAQMEADQKKSLKQRQREKMRAKTGRGVEIDHSRLRDAFFKYQTKPRLTPHGDVYYELRELEVDGSQFRPGFLSEELRAALGVSEGDPPVWLVNMQRYGPPPGYPGLKIPGVNAPIPKGASYGYHMGGWGKPPVDEYGRPIYGDVFGEGLDFGRHDPRFDLNDYEKKKLWGELRKPGSKVTVAVGIDDESEGSSDEEGDREESKQTREVSKPPAMQERGSVQEDERTRQDENVREDMEQRQLYTVLEDRRVSVGQNSLMGSSHVYDINKNRTDSVHPSSSIDEAREKRRREGGEERRDGPVKRSKFKF
eukprot:TRINITY_DN2925_c0_g1_i1.p1 TRINITY_DN2925_c0_g1~~TRINITY_DN2925_c0_g1_i1.p1  ORF type:complete len:575 (+),score=103.34 TRINITY_DN2925_c0_g1_i1:307-2031(+)